MKQFKTTIISIASVLGVFLAACGSDSSSGADTVETSEVKTVYGLGECKGANEGVTKLVTSEDQYYTCSGGEWKVSAAPVDSAKSINELGECKGANDGVTKFVTSEDQYYTCSGGEWKVSATPIDSTKSINGLGECKGANDGVTKFVTSEEQYYKCFNGNWIKTDVPLLSSSSSAGGFTIEASGAVKIDKKKQTILIATPNTEEVCVSENAGAYNWKTVDFGIDSSYSKYLFVSDSSMALFDCEYMDEYGEFQNCDEVGQMMKIAEAWGGLNGVWRMVPCLYDSEMHKSTCFKPCSEVPGGKLTDEEGGVGRTPKEDEDLLTAMTTPVSTDPSQLDRLTCLTPEELTKKGLSEGTITISDTSISSKLTFYYGDNDDGGEFDDYMNSEFMSRFYSNLADGEPSLPGFGNLDEEDSSDVERYKELAGVTVLKQTKNSVSFKFLDKTFSLNVKEYSRSIDKIATTFGIEYDGTKCDFQEERGEVTKSTCNSNYSDFFEKSSKRDANGKSITVAYDYEKSNYKIFDNCIDNMMDSVYALIKKNGGGINDEKDCDALGEAYVRCMEVTDIEEYYDMNCLDVSDDYAKCFINASADDVHSLNKKAVSSREQTKNEFFKVSRKFARKMSRL